MNVCRPVLVILAVCWHAWPLWAESPPAHPPASLERDLDELDRVDRELSDTKRAYAQSRNASTRRQLRQRLEALRAQQERLLTEIERRVGPLPPAVRQDAPIPLEEQLQARQRQHEALLDDNVAPRPRQ